jgi:hypothetical protein
LAQLDELIEALSPVVSALRALGVRHYVVGSVASSFHGASRTTMDVDLVCELKDTHIPTFLQSVGADYYASESAIRDAVQRKSCFNLIHLRTSFKVDIFVSRERLFDREAMRRASLERLGEHRFVEVPIISVEDSIISKLEWYRLTDETSERQLDDARRLLDLCGSNVDRDYLRASAASVGVADLLGGLIDT